MVLSLPSGPACGLMVVIFLYFLYKRTQLALLFTFAFTSFWSATQFLTNPILEARQYVLLPLVLCFVGFATFVYTIYLLTVGDA